jgi:hypothetical protein
MRVHGQTRTWDYLQSPSQFEGSGSERDVVLLVDPDRLATAYTVRDVERNTGAGWSFMTILGIAVACFGVLILVAPIAANYLPE